MKKYFTIRIHLITCLRALVLLFVCPLLLSAQPRDIGYGIFGGFNANSHRAEFYGLPGVPSCCPHYETGNGNGMSAGALLDIPLVDAWSLMLRAAFVSHSSLMKATEATVIAVEGTPTPALIEHSIDARISSFGIEPMLAFSPFGRFRIMLGTHVGIMAVSRFDQSERLVEPVDYGTFENDLRIRNTIDDQAIPNASTLMASLLTGVSYSLPMNEQGTLTLIPEILFSYGLTRIVPDRSWKADAIRAGIAVLYRPESISELPPPPPPALPEPQPVIAERVEPPPAPTATITAVGVDDDGIERPVVTVTVEEFTSEQMRPLLPYVFFEVGSPRLAPRYSSLSNEEAKVFTIDQMYNRSPMEIYHNLLNVIGFRLTEHPSAGITLIGCSDGSSAEMENNQLSRRRAEAVRDYLASVWGIASRRITIRDRGLPENPTKSSEEGAAEENRRVEISSDSPEIMEPVTTRNIERQVTPPILRFKPAVNTAAGIGSWSIEARQGAAIVHDIEGNGAPPARVDWRMGPNFSDVPMTEGPIRYRMHVSDSEGRNSNTPEATIPLGLRTVRTKVVEQTADKEIRRYNLILFDFDSPALDRSNQRIVQRVREEIAANAVVTISGYTDRMGDEVYNWKLSLERAETVARAANQRRAKIIGVGEAEELYDNSLPEGRFLNRTVEIIVETPIQH